MFLYKNKGTFKQQYWQYYTVELQKHSTYKTKHICPKQKKNLKNKNKNQSQPLQKIQIHFMWSYADVKMHFTMLCLETANVNTNMWSHEKFTSINVKPKSYKTNHIWKKIKIKTSKICQTICEVEKAHM